MTDKNFGTLIIWRMADLKISYADLERIANDTGFPTEFIPQPSLPRDAWEKATNLRKGTKLNPPQDLIDRIKRQYDVEPIVRIETKIIDAFTRHIVRSLIIPGSGDKDRELDVESVARLKYDPDRAMQDRFVADYHPDFDSKGASNGQITGVIQRMMADYDHHMLNADGQDMRSHLRRFLDQKLRATCLADGTYFVPANVPGAADYIDSLQAFVLALKPYKTTDNKLTCQVYQVADDGSATSARNRAEIAEDVIVTFKGQLNQVYQDLNTPAKDGRGQRRVENARTRYLELKESLRIYQEHMAEEMLALGGMIQMTKSVFIASIDAG